MQVVASSLLGLEVPGTLPLKGALFLHLHPPVSLPFWEGSSAEFLNLNDSYNFLK